MKAEFIQAYPELTIKCQEMRKDGKSLTEIWRTMLLDKTMSPKRALRILQAVFDLEDSDLAEINSTAFDMSTYHLMAGQGTTNADLLSKIYADTHRKSLAIQVFQQIRKINFNDLYAAWNLVSKQHHELRQADLWDASDQVLGIPPEITSKPFNQFFTLSADVVDRWHTVGFLIDPSRDYLSLRFLIFTDDTPFDIWDEKDLNALDWAIFAYISLNNEALAAFIKIARIYASRLNELGNDAPTFSEITEEEKLLFLHTKERAFYVQRIYPNLVDSPKTLLNVSYDGKNRSFIKAFQVSSGENHVSKNSLGILHLTKKGLEDFCTLLEVKPDRLE